MRWSTTLSEKRATEEAVTEVADVAEAGLGGAQADVLLVFASAHHAGGYRGIPARLRERFPRAHLIGCSAGGVIGAGREVEGRPALSLAAASLPGVEVRPSRFRDPRELPPPGAAPQFLVLGDPFSCDADALVEMLDESHPGARKIGGLASGGGAPGSNALFIDGETDREGAVGLALSGNLTIDTIVAQGCRPIGQPLVITRCEKNIVHELSGKTPMAILRQLYEALPQQDRGLFRTALHVGIEMTGDRVEYKAGDFLIRNVLGVDPENGALAIGALPARYQALQFHVRDASAAAADLSACLDRHRQETAGARPSGALLFSCLGRGEGLYGRPNHDSDLFREKVGAVPLAGFFCNGEIGPVGDRTFVHGYTSSFALFRPGPS